MRKITAGYAAAGNTPHTPLIVPKPQAVFDRYDDEQIEQWNIEDRLDGDERQRMIEELTRSDLDPKT